MRICEHFNKDRSEIYLSKSVFKLESSGYIEFHKLFSLLIVLERSTFLLTPSWTRTNDLFCPKYGRIASLPFALLPIFSELTLLFSATGSSRVRSS